MKTTLSRSAGLLLASLLSAAAFGCGDTHAEDTRDEGALTQDDGRLTQDEILAEETGELISKGKEFVIDGKEVFFFDPEPGRKMSLLVRNLDDGTSRKLAEVVDPYNSLSSLAVDAANVYFSHERGIWSVPRSGGVLKQLADTRAIEASGRVNRITGIAAERDGDALLFACEEEDIGTGRLMRISKRAIPNNVPKRVLSLDDGGAWRSDGKFVYRLDVRRDWIDEPIYATGMKVYPIATLTESTPTVLFDAAMHSNLLLYSGHQERNSTDDEPDQANIHRAFMITEPGRAFFGSGVLTTGGREVAVVVEGRDGQIKTTPREAVDRTPAAPVIDEKTVCHGKASNRIVCIREGSATPFEVMRTKFRFNRITNVATTPGYVVWVLGFDRGIRVQKVGG